jgi:hypothetical protein
MKLISQSVRQTDTQSVSSQIHVMNANIHSNDEGENEFSDSQGKFCKYII